MKTQVARKVLYVIAVLLMVGCTSPYRWEPTREEVVPLDSVEGILPQEGTVLTLDLSYVFLTKFQSIVYTLPYRYRVFINDQIYSYGVVTHSTDSPLSIPLMANDGYTRNKIVVEGSEALDYISSKENETKPVDWSDWHELYRGEQECLQVDQVQKYASLKDSRMSLEIDGKHLTLDFAHNNTAEAFKRYLSKKVIHADVITTTVMRPDRSKEQELLSRLKSSIPDNHTDEWKSGTLYFANGEFFLILDEEWCGADYTYKSIVGTVVTKDLSILKTLAHIEEKYHTTATLSLE
jgi:hypothetical protein